MPAHEFIVPIKSTWRDPIGKQLTNRIIANRIREGWYGEAMKLAALAKLPVHQTDGTLNRCACGELRGVRWYDYKYLEQPAFLCPRCLATKRTNKGVRPTNARRMRDISEFV